VAGGDSVRRFFTGGLSRAMLREASTAAKPNREPDLPPRQNVLTDYVAP
jgi:hypothetical protein